MPRRRIEPDAPPLPAALWTPAPVVAGGVAGVLVGVAWGWAGGEWVEWAAGGLFGLAAGVTAALLIEARADRRRAGGAEAGLKGERPAGWAEEARGASRHHAEQLARASDGPGDPYLSTQRYVGEFFRRANAWADATRGRLVGRFPLWALAAVLGVAGGCVRLTPERAKELNFVALGWPAVLSAVVGTLGGAEALGRGGRWERVWARWREWATDREAPALPPPSPLVPVSAPPPPKPKPVPPPPPPPVVPLVKPPPPPPPPPKPVPPPPPAPPIFDAFKNWNPPPPDDGNDAKG